MKKINKVILCLLSLLCILTTIGLLNFGHGLGDIVLVVAVILLTLIHLALTLYLSRKKNNGFWVYMVIFFGGVCLYILYKSTIGRGGEFVWDGNIFFIK